MSEEEATHNQLRDMIHDHNLAVVREIGAVNQSIVALNGKVDLVQQTQDEMRKTVNSNIKSIQSLEDTASEQQAWIHDQRLAVRWGRRAIFVVAAIGTFFIGGEDAWALLKAFFKSLKT